MGGGGRCYASVWTRVFREGGVGSAKQNVPHGASVMSYSSYYLVWPDNTTVAAILNSLTELGLTEAEV